MKRLFLMLQFMFICIISLANENYPIIFVNGHSSGADAQAGIKHWYPSSSYKTAMTKIISQNYQGYQYGLKANDSLAYNCNMNTSLNPMPDSKRIYNFSYYHPSGERGVISCSNDSILVYIKWVYDKIGRHRPIVIAPFNPNYPPSDYDSTTYYPKYVPHMLTDIVPGHGIVWFADGLVAEYINSWRRGKFAKRLTEFIDKVLAATGAEKVDIVSHSMGGLVSRVAIKNYGCSSKVRKLLMVGTPNHPYDRWWEELYQVYGSDKGWQKNGENLEMGLAFSSGDNAYFINLENAYEDQWGNFLGYDNYIESMATIAGNKGKSYFGNVDNDGVVAVNQVHLNSAQFNSVIYASHSYEGIPEEALTTCSYTANKKVWGQVLIFEFFKLLC